MVGGLLRARRRGSGTRQIRGDDRHRGEVAQMFTGLASLAQGHAKRTVILAAVFFVVAGALGGGVAKKLAPYGADDPSTESVRATDRMQTDGYRDPSVLVLLQDTVPTSPAGQQKIKGIEQKLHANPDVAHVTGYLETHSADFISAP